MRLIWDWIETWVKQHAPEALNNWYPGASEQEIQQVEQALGIIFPDDMRASWLIHDGTRFAFADIWRLLSMQEILEQHRQDMTYPWWPASWIAFAANDCGDYLCFESDSTRSDQSGHIMCSVHDGEDRQVASSFSLLMSWFVNDLLDGEYEVNAWGGLESEDSLFIN
jgi:cell wall assembly regulator SMI1